MIDAHCHLNFKVFENDLNLVIKNAFDAGVDKIINVGSSLESSKRAVELAEKYDPPAGGLYAAVGVHPHHADKVEPDWIEQLKKLAKHPKVVAIGETGMDYYNYQSNGIVEPKLQREIFIKQIELAYKLKLPLQIHNRQAGKEIIKVLSNHKSYLLNLPGMFHCFSGDFELLRSALKMGFYIGFDGNVTYKGLAKGETTKLSELVKTAPLESIITETDSPYLTPQPYRGRRNEPEYAIIVAEQIAKIKGESFEKVEAQTTKNANKLFRL